MPVDFVFYVEAARSFLQGGPYTLYNPPWVLFPLIPFAVLPFGRWLMLAAAMAALAYIAYRQGAKPLGVLGFLACPFTFNSLLLGNIEFIPLLGLVMPQGAGMVLLALKPQMTIGVMAFWAVEAWRDRGLRGVVRLVAPLAIVALASLLAFGPYPLRMLDYSQFQTSPDNYGFFPLSLPFGIALIAEGLRTRQFPLALAASPFFFPVVTPQTYMVVILALVSFSWWTLAAAVGTWAAVAMVKLS